MSADSPRRSSGGATRGMVAVPSIVPPQVVSDRSILDSAIGFINEVTLAHQPLTDPKDTITWARFETAADISDPRFGEDWELDGNVAPPLLLILGYGLGVQVWAIPANGEAVEVLSWRHGIVSALRVLPTPSSSVAIEENGRADEPTDVFAEKRPIIALVDGSSSSGSQPQFCAVNFISLKTGTQVKTIKFKNPVIDILANRSSIVITFHERIAIFDARTLEDRLSITTCYPSPGINPNPVALGPRWLAYAEHKLLHSKRSGGGCDGDGVASYTATVLNASKSLVKGLRELGEQVAAGLTGTSGSAGSSKNTSFDSGMGPDSKQSGIVTIIDVKNPLRDYSPTSGVPMSSNQTAGTDPIIAHFIAHSEALVSMEFDNSGMILVTADRRGHDFHVFRIQPNPVGPSLAAVHHLYVLHRGDTSAKVQNISLSLDSRWVAVSTLRGTTHVFPITPYGGLMGVRTHTSLHVVNKLSRFHRSAGLSAEGRSNSPISHSESTTFSQSLQPYHNPTLPPFPRPTVVMPLAQLRQPFALGSPPGSATLAGVKSAAGGGSSTGTQRQRLSSLSDDSGKPLSVCAIFAKSRSWLLDPPNVTREAPHRMQRKAVDSLFVMAGHGALIQYDLDTKLASNVAKEKICDDTPIELEVEAKAQWNLGRRKEGSQEIMPPLSLDNWLVKNRNSCMLTDSTRQYDDSDDRGESWLAQVEIVTHAGPHRRLWMGPQFVFKTYNTPSGSNLSHVDIEAVEIGTSKSNTATTTSKPEHSSPLNMPLTAAGRSSAVPVLIESGSYSSIEQSPKLMDRFRHDHLDSDYAVTHGDSRLKEDLADAMRESPASSKDSGRGCETGGSGDNVAFYDALTDHDDQEDHDYIHARTASAAALASALPNIHSYDNSSSYESLDSLKRPKASIEKIVNPLGTVTTVTSCLTADVQTDILDEVVSQLAAEDTIIHENCDESLFRPFVAIFCDEKTRLKNEEEARKNQEHCQPPEMISTKLVVPVIAKEVDDELNKKEKQKSSAAKVKIVIDKELENLARDQSKFEELSSLNKKSKAFIGDDDDAKKAKDVIKIDERNVKESGSLDRKASGAEECEKRSQVCKSSEKTKEKNEKESLKKPENRVTKSAPEKKISMEKEISLMNPIYSKEKSNTQGTENNKSTELEDEKPIEFIRMTSRATSEKVCSQKVVPKKEIKKQQQKAKDESVKPRIDKENAKKREAEDKLDTESKILSDEMITKEIKTDKDKNKQLPEKLVKKSAISESNNDRISEENVKDIKATCEKNRETKKEPIREEENDIIAVSCKETPNTKSTAITSKDQAKPSSNTKELEDKGKMLQLGQMTPSSEAKDKKQTALNVKLNSNDKTVMEEGIKTVSEIEKDGAKTTKPDTKKDVIKTEQLNVNDLADSLIEIQAEELEKTKCVEIKKKVEENSKVETPLLETVDIFAAPTKSSKKNKKKGNKSESSSENEEIVEVLKQSSTKTKPETVEKSALTKKNSTSSEESYTDWADSILERNDVLKETMFASFTQTEERKPAGDQGKLKEIKKVENLKVGDKKNEGKLDLNKETGEENINKLKQERSIKTTDKVEVKHEQTAIKSNKPEEEFKRAEKETVNIKLSGKEDKSNKEATNSETLSNDKSGKESAAKSEEKTVLKTNIKKKFQEEKPDIAEIEKSIRVKQTEKEKSCEIDISENTPSNDTEIEGSKKEEENISTKIITDKREQPASKDKHTKEQKKDQKKLPVRESRDDKPEEKSLKADEIKNLNTKAQKEEQNDNKETKLEHTRQEEIKVKISSSIQDMTKQSSKESPSAKDTNQKITPPVSPTKKDQCESNKTEPAKDSTADVMTVKGMKKSHDTKEDVKKIQYGTMLKDDKKKDEITKTNSIKKDITKEEKPKLNQKQTPIDTAESCEKATSTFKHDMPKKSADKAQTNVVVPATPPPTSAWKTLSGAEMINKNLNKPDTDTLKFPSLGAISKSNATKLATNTDKLLPELPTPKDMKESSLSLGKILKKTKTSSPLDDFSILKPLESLPPLPALEPLDLLTENRSNNLKDFSLINFESPLQENPALQRKITPPPRGFTEQNLIFALCGSLHYENEHMRSSPEKIDISPTLSSNRSSSAMDEPSMADYKSLTENDDPYISLEQSSQDTNTTNTNTTNEKFSSSTNSSGSEEIIIMEEKKMTKKQKRKRQQQLLELQKQKEQQSQQQQHHHHEMDDEELRPLIAMTESQIDQIPSGGSETTTLPTLLDGSFSIKSLQPLTHSTTTDSEGPLPATTSDDNVFTIPAVAGQSQHKIKTKKLEHKINLIAAIEAATSSSTSSAEESGVELGGGRRSSHDNDESLISVANSVAATNLPLPIVVNPQTTVGALKKKTKRRKR